MAAERVLTFGVILWSGKNTLDNSSAIFYTCTGCVAE